MLDKLLIKNVRDVLLVGLADLSITAAVKQSFQPTMQGANSAPTIYLFKVGDRRVGSPRRRTKTTVNPLKWGAFKWGGAASGPKWGQEQWGQFQWTQKDLTGARKWGEVTYETTHDETQQYETTFQVNAMVAQDPADTSGLTAADLVNYAAAIMQGESAIAALRAQDIGILRVTDVRNPYFQNDKGQFEASPSFDFTLTHKQVIASTVPIVVSTEYNIQRV